MSARSRYGKIFCEPYLELMRGDPAARRSRTALNAASRDEHGMLQYFDAAELHSGWARGRIDDRDGWRSRGSTDMRRGLSISGASRTFWCSDGLLKLALARGRSARGRSGPRARDRIDEALATVATALGIARSMPTCIALRGEILLKRDPADPAPAEEAFLTAIAVAKQQGARSFELLRVACARQALSIDRPPRRSPRRPRARPRRLFADARNARDR